MSNRDSGQGSRALSGDATIPAAGDIVAGKYRVDGLLGIGGMGVVVSARHMQLGQRVAIKFMRSTSNDEASIERFFREARAVVALSSEHVAKVLDMGTLETGVPYIVMEFLAGVDLGEWLRLHGPMPIDSALGAVLQACEAIAEAHSVGIVHRDLKPSNLFITTHLDGASFVKVLDFGISKITEGHTLTNRDLTASGAVIGSPGYMSPEQVRNSKHIDARSDIWAMGVILYEALSGVSPFPGESIGEVLAKVVSESPVRIDELRADVPAPLVAAIAKCLERDPARRFAHLGELASVLLPFAPAEATVSVRRILRISSAGESSQANAHTLAAPLAALAARDARGSSAPAETGPPWLRSRAESGRPRWGGLIGRLTVGLILAGAGAAIYVSNRGPAGPPTRDGAMQVDSIRVAPPERLFPVPIPLVLVPEAGDHDGLAASPAERRGDGPAADADVSPPTAKHAPIGHPAPHPRPSSAKPATGSPSGTASAPVETDVF